MYIVAAMLLTIIPRFLAIDPCMDSTILLHRKRLEKGNDYTTYAVYGHELGQIEPLD